MSGITSKNANISTKTIFDLPDILIRKICQLLISSFEGDGTPLQDILSFRATNCHFYELINDQFLMIPFTISIVNYFTAGAEKFNKSLVNYFEFLSTQTCWHINKILTHGSIIQSDNEFYEKFSNIIQEIVADYWMLFWRPMKAVEIQATNSGFLNIQNPPLSLAEKIYPTISPDFVPLTLSLSIFGQNHLELLTFDYFPLVKKLDLLFAHSDVSLAQNFITMCPAVEELTVTQTSSVADGFDLNLLKDTSLNLKRLKVNRLKIQTETPLKTKFRQVESLQLIDDQKENELLDGFVSRHFPNVSYLSFIRPPVTVSLISLRQPTFYIPKNLISLKTNSELFTRIADEDLSNLEELYLLYDESSERKLKSKFEKLKTSMPNLKLLNLTVSTTIQNYSVTKLWELVQVIAKSSRSIKVLSVRGITGNSIGEASYTCIDDAKFRKVSKKYFKFRSRSSLNMLNFFEHVFMTYKLDEATIRRMDFLDENYDWHLAAASKILSRNIKIDENL